MIHAITKKFSIPLIIFIMISGCLDDAVTSESDEIEAKAAAHVFSTGDDDALAAMHMYRILQRMDDVANACEKAANAFLPSLSR